MLHTTATDDITGHKYTVIRTRTTHIVIGLVAVSLIINIVSFYILWDYTRRISNIEEHTEKQKQRNAAMDEMLLNRATTQRWVYERVCEQEKIKGKLCIDNPVWWADPNKYPLIKNDPSGTGLFPRVTGE